MSTLTVITGPMFSGKSTELIRQIRREQIAEKEMQLFNFGEDARYAQRGKLASYDGSDMQAIPVCRTRDLIALVQPETQFIVIDEVQFFDDVIIDYISHLVDQGKRVMAAGLNLDFRGEPFPFGFGSTRTMADLLVRADFIVKLSAVCTYRSDAGERCGREATRTQRLVGGEPAQYSDPIKMIGSQESYEARCVRHHMVPGKVCPLPTVALRQPVILENPYGKSSPVY
ncbi:MAG: thymidine kinase [Patescibacteria group bacterium]